MKLSKRIYFQGAVYVINSSWQRLRKEYHPTWSGSLVQPRIRTYQESFLVYRWLQIVLRRVGSTQTTRPIIAKFSCVGEFGSLEDLGLIANASTLIAQEFPDRKEEFPGLTLSG